MNSNERRLKILYMLQSGKKITSRTLMDQFGISKRTVFRDLKVIQDLGVPVTHYPDMGYGVLRDGLIPAIMFSFRELSVIMMGLSFVKSQIDPEMVRDAENVSLKIRSAVPSALQTQMNILENRTLVSPYIKNVEVRESGGDWFILCSAFVENKSVSFVYRDRKKKATKRTIDPCLLIHYTDHWNVIGFCHDKKAFRNFMLSRMSNLVLNDIPSKIHREYSHEDLLYGRSEETTTITIRIPAEKAFSLLSALPGKIISRSLSNGQLEISFLFDDMDYINQWLLGFGTHVNILSPAILRQKRKRLLQQLLDDMPDLTEKV